MNHREELLRIKRDWVGCKRCGLSDIRAADHHVVFGWGSIPADYLFVYDAPSEEEGASGTPLLGRYGELLESVIQDADFPKGSWAITPMVGCRPYVVLPATEDTEAQVRERDPNDDELDACASRLEPIIYHTDPRIIIAVGEIPWKRLVRPKDRGDFTTLDTAAGNLFVSYLNGVRDKIPYPLVPILPPKKIIANPSSAKHGPIATTISTLQRVKYYVNQIKKMEERTDT